MTRREEIQQAILENGIDYCEEHPEMNMSLKEAFVMGAVWADKTMIEKACEYAEARYDLDYCGNVKDILNYLKSLVEE